jgi:TolB-like protein/DNA-binding winged helix-turn-helix (wHTH) protein
VNAPEKLPTRGERQSISGADTLTFGAFTLDPGRRSLAKGGMVLNLRPKSFDVLCVLANTPGELVTKDVIAQAAWPGVVMTDESLARCISDIRQALGDEGQALIKTVPRRGYVLAPPAHAAPNDIPPLPAAPPAAESRPDNVSRRRLILGVAAAAAATAAAAWWIRRQTPQVGVDRPSVAVLPFINANANRDQDYFSDGLTEDITIRLSKFAELLVISSHSSLTYKGKAADPKDVGARLGVRYLVDGSVRRDGNRLRISARLIEAETGAQRWAESYERDERAIFALQDELAQRVVAVLVARVTQSELERASRLPASSLGAYDLFLRGRALLAMVDASAEGQYGRRVYEARQTLQQAVDADPQYAPALAALSDSYNRAWLVASDFPAIKGEFQSPAVSAKALALAERAVAVDPTLAEAHAQYAWVLHWQYKRDLALAEFRRAMDLNPNMADGRFALVLLHSGKPQESIDFLQRVFRLDPLHRPIYLSYLANAYYLAREYQASFDTSRLAVDRMPAVFQARAWMAAAAAQLGRVDDARTAAAATLRLRPEFTISRFLKMVRLADAGQQKHLEEGLRKAGLPE